MNTKPTHFIVVDDDAINNRMCRFSISKHFRSVPVATFLDPESALKAIESQYAIGEEIKPTVLFLDIHMPQMSGWDFLDVFAGFDPAIKDQFSIYILSGSAHQSDRIKAAAHPLISGYISKPLTTTAMDRVLSALQMAA